MLTLLHASDLHFGPHYLPRVGDAFLRAAHELAPDAIVISGDFTQRAKRVQYAAAAAFLERLPPVPRIVVPGNHDVPLYRVWERVFDPFGAYRRHFSPELEPVFSDERLFVVGINTAHGWTLKEGRIPLPRLLQVAEMFEQVPESALKVVVAHHHLIPPPNFGTQTVLANAYEAIDVFSTVGVDLVLSGHQHQAYIGSSEEFYPKGRPPVVICHSGTTTSNRGRMGERERNSCNWIAFDEQSLTVSQHRWHREEGYFAEHSRHWYPRQERRPFSLGGLAPPSPRE